MQAATTRNDAQFDAENREAEAIALAAINAHKASGGRFGYVSWKHEGRYGPVYIGVWREPAAETTITEEAFGNLCEACGWDEIMHSRSRSTEGDFYLGWMSRTEARRLAKWAGVPLTDA